MGLFGYYQALIRRTSHFVNNQQKSIKKNQFSSFGIVAGYYQGAIIAVVGVGCF
ncbi:hypothetical protein KGE51_10140 [Lactobacillus amylovorus]|nr:hypothetical protein [Lactobacillus amylovorus]UIK34978.1 hypothetical protein KGE51_10140 [Lactobacillus amylovorus]